MAYLSGSELKERISILLRVSQQDDDYGTQVGEWGVFAARLPAKMVIHAQGKGGESSSDVTVPSESATAICRYLSGVTSAMRVVWHGDVEQTFDILSLPVMLGRRGFLQLSLKFIPVQK